MQKGTKNTVISFLEIHIFSSILYAPISLYWRKVKAVSAEQVYLSKYQFVIFISEKS